MEFKYICHTCDYKTNKLSNYHTHCRGKKHIDKKSGVKKNFCELCNKQFTQKSNYEAHLLSVSHMMKAHQQKVSTSKLIKSLLKEMKTNENKIDAIDEHMESYEKKNMVYSFIPEEYEKYKKIIPSWYKDAEEELDKIHSDNFKLCKKIMKYEKQINRILLNTITPLGKLICNWRMNLNM